MRGRVEDGVVIDLQRDMPGADADNLIQHLCSLIRDSEVFGLELHKIELFVLCFEGEVGDVDLD